MAKLAFIKFLVPFVLACLFNETEISAKSPFLNNIMLNHVAQETHWKDMWFDQFGGEGKWNPISKLWTADVNFGTYDRLRLIPPLMGCAYGVQLNHYLLLAVEAIDMCNEMRRNKNDNAADCKTKVRQSIAKGKTVVIKLMHTLHVVYYKAHNALGNIGNDRFSSILSSLEAFTKGRIHIELSGLVLGGLTINRLFNTVAVSLGKFLGDNCKPDYELFDKTANGDPYGIYSYYVEKLDSYTDYIGGHLDLIGF